MIPLPDLLIVAGIVAGLAAVLAAVGLALLRIVRGRSVALMLAVVAVVTVASTLAGVVVTAMAMFISPHDRSVVLVLVVAAGLVGLAVALLLGRSVVSASRALREAVRSVPGEGAYRRPDVTLPVELAELSRELEEAHARLQQSRTRERALDASRRELVAWVSHDLRSPLAGLRAMAEALEDGVAGDPGTVARYHAQMRREVDRLAEMVDDLFELSRIHAGTLRLSPRRVELEELVAGVMASAGPLAETSRVRLSGSALPGLPVEIDVAEMERALRNVVVNAIRHTPHDAVVEVAGTSVDGMATVTVSDACGGIPEADLARVFDVAFRGEPARTPGPQHGAGLGLAIARGIVEAHAGEIGVVNAAAGCRFTVRLPLHP